MTANPYCLFCEVHSTVLNSGLLPVQEYFHSVALVLLVKDLNTSSTSGLQLFIGQRYCRTFKDITLGSVMDIFHYSLTVLR